MLFTMVSFCMHIPPCFTLLIGPKWDSRIVYVAYHYVLTAIMTLMVTVEYKIANQSLLFIGRNCYFEFNHSIANVSVKLMCLTKFNSNSEAGQKIQNLIVLTIV